MKGVRFQLTEGFVIFSKQAQVLLLCFSVLMCAAFVRITALRPDRGWAGVNADLCSALPL